MKVLQRSVIGLFVMICFCCVPASVWASSTKNVEKTAKASAEKIQKTAAKTAPLDLNTATVDELKSLNGIGDKKAQAIVDYRKKNGPFKTPEDIMKVSGIGESIYKKNKSMLTAASLPPAKTKSKKK